MGFALNKLMQQYGVSTPGATYGGEASPAALATGATAGDIAARDAAQARYAADQAVYNTYRQQFRDRVDATPMYTEEQYQTRLPGASAARAITDQYARAARTGFGTGEAQIDRPGYDYWMRQLGSGDTTMGSLETNMRSGSTARDIAARDAMDASGVSPAQQPITTNGLTAYRDGINAWLAANQGNLSTTPRALRNYMDAGGISGYDVAKARGSDSIWGNTPLASPVYSVAPGTPGQIPVTPPVIRMPPPTPDQAAAHRAAILNQYGLWGRTEMGSAANQIDQAGLDYWMNQLASGALTLDTLPGAMASGRGSGAILNRYGEWGRSGFGDAYNQIDTPGYDYWMTQWNRGNITLEQLLANMDAGRIPAGGPYYTQVSTPIVNNTAVDPVREQITNTGAYVNPITAQMSWDTPQYSQAVLDQYGALGRAGMGTASNQIDQGGYDYWMDQLASGAVAPTALAGAMRAGAVANPWQEQSYFEQANARGGLIRGAPKGYASGGAYAGGGRDTSIPSPLARMARDSQGYIYRSPPGEAYRGPPGDVVHDGVGWKLREMPDESGFRQPTARPNWEDRIAPSLPPIPIRHFQRPSDDLSRSELHDMLTSRGGYAMPDESGFRQPTASPNWEDRTPPPDIGRDSLPPIWEDPLSRIPLPLPNTQTAADPHSALRAQIANDALYAPRPGLQLPSRLVVNTPLPPEPEQSYFEQANARGGLIKGYASGGTYVSGGVDTSIPSPLTQLAVSDAEMTSPRSAEDSSTDYDTDAVPIVRVDTDTQSPLGQLIYILPTEMGNTDQPTAPQMPTDMSFGQFLANLPANIVAMFSGVNDPPGLDAAANAAAAEAVGQAASDSETGNTSGTSDIGGAILNRGGAVEKMARKYNLGGAVQHPLVRKYKVGGAVQHPLVRKYQEGGDVAEGEDATADPTIAADPALAADPARSAAAPVPAAAAVLSGGARGAARLDAAIARNAEARQAFSDYITKMRDEPDAAPDKAEMYFRLAAAFGAPSKTGHFGENLSFAGKEMAEYSKDMRATTTAAKAARRQLALEGLKFGATTTAAELRTIQEDTRAGAAAQATVSAAALADKNRRDAAELLAASQDKWAKAARALGLIPGTPDYIAFVKDAIAKDAEERRAETAAKLELSKQGQATREGQLEVARNQSLLDLERANATDAKDMAVAQGLYDASRTAIYNLDKAITLNDNALGGRGKEGIALAVGTTIGSTNARVANTQEQENLLANAALSQLKDRFGGNISDGERLALAAVQGIGSATTEVRGRIMKTAMGALITIERRQKKTVADFAERKANRAARTAVPPAGE